MEDLPQPKKMKALTLIKSQNYPCLIKGPRLNSFFLTPKSLSHDPKFLIQIN